MALLIGQFWFNDTHFETTLMVIKLTRENENRGGIESRSSPMEQVNQKDKAEKTHSLFHLSLPLRRRHRG